MTSLEKKDALRWEATSPSGAGRHRLADHSVWRIGFGAMQVSGDPAFLGSASATLDRAEAVAVLRAAVDAGVDHIDTAAFYGAGTSNAIIRQALHPYPDELALVSKVVARTAAPGGTHPELRQQIVQNLSELGVDRLAAVNLRLPNDATPGPQFIDQVGSLIEARDEGLIGGVGLSNISHPHLVAALEVTDIACVQNFYNYEGRSSQSILQECRDHGIAFVPYCPLGYPRDQHDRILNDPELRAIASARGVSTAQVALAWLLTVAPNVLLIPGTRSRSHLAENLAVDELILDEHELAQLDTSCTADDI